MRASFVSRSDDPDMRAVPLALARASRKARSLAEQSETPWLVRVDFLAGKAGSAGERADARLLDLFAQASPPVLTAIVRHLGKSNEIVAHMNKALDEGQQIEDIIRSLPRHYAFSIDRQGQGTVNLFFRVAPERRNFSGHAESWLVKIDVQGKIVSAERSSGMFID